MSGKKTLKTDDYLAMELHEFTPEVIDPMSFGHLSRVLERHLETTLNGRWGGSRIFEIQQAVALQDIRMDFLSAVTSKGTGTQILAHFYHRPHAELMVRCFTKANLQKHEGRAEFGQFVGKTALAILAHRARLALKRVQEPLGPVDLEWTYNKP